MIRKNSVFLIAVVIALATSATPAAELHVGPGETYTTIQAGIDAAVNGDVVIVADGRYLLSDGGLDFGGKIIRVSSMNGADHCTIACDLQSPIRFGNGESRDAVLQGFTLDDEPMPGGYRSAVIEITGCSPTIRDCIVINSEKDAINISEGGPLIENCQLLYNSGGVVGEMRGAVIRNCIMKRNLGVGVFVFEGEACVENCLIVENCTYYRAQSIGISTANGPTNVTVSNCTIGYGISSDPIGIRIAQIDEACDVLIENCIIRDRAWGISWPGNDLLNLSVRYSNVDGFWAHNGEGNSDANLQLVDPANGDYRLKGISPCIDAGNPDSLIGQGATDLAGRSRVLYGRVDMGAYECTSSDYDRDGTVDMADAAHFALKWNEIQCLEPEWCGQADLNLDSIVGYADLRVLTAEWLSTRSDPVAYWKFNEGSGYATSDNSQNVRTGYLWGGLDEFGWVEGVQGNALALDGVDDLVTVFGYKGIEGGQSRTVCAWIRTDTPERVVIAWGLNGTPGGRWVFSTSAAGQLRVGIGGGFIEATADVCDGEWHHVAAVLENDGSPNINEVRLYVDGLPDAPSVNESNRVIDTLAGSDVTIGAYLDAGFFAGTIDEVRLYDRPLSAEEIAALAL